MYEHHILHNHGGLFDQGTISMPSENEFQSAADLFRKLDDPSRLRIFWVLCHSEVCVSNLSELLQMSSPAISHHLRQLKDAGLVTTRREGKEVCYRVVDTPEARTLHTAIEKILDISCPK